MDCSLPGSSVHEIFQARVLEWIAVSFSRGSSQPRDRTQVSHHAGRCFTISATREAIIEPFNFSFFGISSWGIDLDYCDIEWFALETNRDHPVVLETASEYCISDSLVDYESYSISSKGFLPTLVDKMVIWIKFLIKRGPLEKRMQTTSVFLPWEPHEQYEKAKR